MIYSTDRDSLWRNAKIGSRTAVVVWLSDGPLKLTSDIEGFTCSILNSLTSINLSAPVLSAWQCRPRRLLCDLQGTQTIFYINFRIQCALYNAWITEAVQGIFEDLLWLRITSFLIIVPNILCTIYFVWGQQLLVWWLPSIWIQVVKGKPTDLLNSGISQNGDKIL